MNRFGFKEEGGGGKLERVRDVPDVDTTGRRPIAGS